MNGEIYQQPEGYLPQEGGVPFMYPSPPIEDFSTESSLRFQLDPDELIKRLRHILTGYEQIINPKTEGEEWKKSITRKPLINEEGMNVFEPIFRGYLDKLFPLSDLENTQIENITLKVEANIRDLITINFLSGNPWEIKDLSTSSLIKDIICDQVYATQRKAYLRGYQTFLKTIQRYTEIRNLQQRPERQIQEQKSGLGRIPILGRFFG